MIREYDRHNPKIDDSCYVSDNATVIGKVELKENANVWYGAVLRGDVNEIIVGKNSNIQDNCTVHNSSTFPTVIGDNVTVGHNAVLHACTIGDNVLVGMSAIVLDGAAIGDNVIVGAGSLVPPGKSIPSNSLVMGSPAKIVRQLSDQDRENLKESAIKYVQLANIHKNK